MNTNNKVTLYKKVKNNNVRTWSATLEFYSVSTIIKIEIKSSLKGKTQKFYRKYKNINVSEMNSIFNTIVKKKLREGYKDVSIDEVDLLEVNLTDALGRMIPMKAKLFKSNTASYPAILQPKLNGLRGLVIAYEINDGLFGFKRKIDIFSNRNKTYPAENIIFDMTKIINDNPIEDILEIGFDGELYAHNMPLQEIRSKVYKNHYHIKYVIFDMAIEDKLQIERLEYLKSIICNLTISDKTKINVFNNLITRFSEFEIDFSSIRDYTDVIIPIETISIQLLKNFIVHNDNQAKLLADRFIELGFEGGILRELDGSYEFGKRSSYLMKFKKFKTTYVKIIDIEKSTYSNYNSKPIAIFVCENDLNKKTFKVNPAGTLSERRDILLNRNKYINKLVEIKFYERTVDKIPFHANVINNPKV